MRSTWLIVPFSAWGGLAAVLQGREVGGNCRDVSFTVTATAQNYDLSALSALTDLFKNDSTLLQSDTLVSQIERIALRGVPVIGLETIAATYCEPTRANSSRSDTLQLLVHELTFDRNYWRATAQHYQPYNYSWVEYALDQGYPILAIDRVGHGQSSHPDPLLNLQLPYEIRLMHSLVSSIREGNTGSLPRRFTKIVGASSGSGSILLDNVAADFPDDFSALVLMSFSAYVSVQGLAGIVATVPLPAASVSPQRFGGLPSGYLVTSSKIGRRNLLYYPGGFDPHIRDIDFDTQDVAGLAFIVTVVIGITSAPGFRGPVLVLTGDHDTAFCGDMILGGGCAASMERTRFLFPSSVRFNSFVVPNTGDLLNYHYTARNTFARVHDFLDSAGF